jgi:hypothetical protein
MRLFVSCTVITALALCAGPALAAAPAPEVRVGGTCADAPLVARPWAVTFGSTSLEPAPVRTISLAAASQGAVTATKREVPFEYSDAYQVRARIHKYAAFLTLPIFGSMYYVGQKLYDGNDSDNMKSLHVTLASATAGLFGVNTITGGWNLWEGRKDPNHRAKRMIHGLLMLAADGGFVATGLMAPEDENRRGSNNASNHRTVALASMGVATASYLMMLVWR